jgi:lipoprotein-releasing system permease protein
MQYAGAMQDYQKVMNEVDQAEGVVASTPFIFSQAMLRNEGRTSGVILRGISIDNAFKVINLGKMHEGNIDYLSEKKRSTLELGKDTSMLPGIVIGKELAKNMGLLLFDPVSIISPMGISTPMGMVPKMKKFVVVGIFDSGFYEYDSTLAYISLRDCQEFLNLGERVTGLEIKVNDIYRANIIAKSIEKKLGFPFWARNWMEMNKNLFSALRLEKRVMFIILSLIVLVAAFNIICTLIMIVMEKNKDIAVLKSMGATSGSIMKIFVYQGVTIGAIGTLLGCIGGLAVALNLEKISLSIENLFGFKILPGDVYYLSQLPSQVNYSDVVIIIIGTMLICFLSTIYPSLRASKLDPAEALRYD